ncbi:NAD(P)-binding protein [Astrocystis sublimbata]|nr:NAD(P)-binding protein [Astrocystis sublimbata]
MTETVAEHSLPDTYTGLLFQSPSSPPRLEPLPTPTPTAGAVIVKPLYAIIVQYVNEIFANGNSRGYKYPLPLVPGGTCIARVAGLPPDSTSLQLGQLVFVELTVRARDDHAGHTKILRGFNEGTTEGTRRLMRGAWRSGCWATLATAPMESVHVLDEDVLVRRLGYRLEELGCLSQLVVPHGGLSDIRLKAGETVLIAPATGSFGSAAVHVALAMGARVIAMGRSETALAKLKDLSDRIETVKMSGVLQEDIDALAQFLGRVDVYFDITPPQAGKASHIEAGIACLKPGGRMSLMGGVRGNLELPYGQIVHKALTIKGTFMNTAQQAEHLVKLVETGVLKIGYRASMTISGKFGLDDWEKAFHTAAVERGPGKSVYFVPNGEDPSDHET